MKTIEIYESITCCSSTIDKEIVHITSIINSLQDNHVKIIRHNLPNNPQAFVEQKEVSDQVEEKGVRVLPITLVDGKIVKSEAYPTSADFCKWIGVEISEKEIGSENKISNCDCNCN